MGNQRVLGSRLGREESHMGWFARVPSFNETWLVNRSNCEDIFLQGRAWREQAGVAFGELGRVTPFGRTRTTPGVSITSQYASGEPLIR